MTQHINTTSTHSNTRGFTLVELTLAIVIGGLVLLGVSGVFAAAQNMERIFGNQYTASTQLHITQITIRRSLLSLQMREDQRPNTNEESGIDTSAVEDPERSRIILEADPIYSSLTGPWQPQRFEVVLSAPPIALNMATKAAAWARINDRDEDSLDFSTEDASGGVLRSVFELRPDGFREGIMRRVGIMDPDLRADEQLLTSNLSSGGWTLWWRPILRTEGNYLRDGGLPLDDSIGTEEEIRFRLAGAIPLVSGIQSCLWTIFKGDEKINEYTALSMSDLPAYAEFELLLEDGQYASWMFEVDWVLGDDPLDIVDEDAIDEDETTDDGEDTGDQNPPNNPNDPSPPGDGGGTVLPDRDTNNSMGGRQN